MVVGAELLSTASGGFAVGRGVPGNMGTSNCLDLQEALFTKKKIIIKYNKKISLTRRKSS